MESHYSSIAVHYDDLYNFMYGPLAELAIQHLQIKPTDKVIDVGAGTGGVAHQLWMKADLKTPVLAVEPNRRLLAKSYSKPGIVSRLSSADDIFKSQEIATYDKLLLCNVAHHFDDPDEVFTNLLSGIKSTARCLVTNLSTEHMPYMWRDAQDRFNLATQADIPATISRAGFKTKTFTQIVTFKCTKEDWYSKLRRRIFSSLQVYTDEEIEEGIDELENTKLRGVPLSEEIELPQGIICTVATLPSYKI